MGLHEHFRAKRPDCLCLHNKVGFEWLKTQKPDCQRIETIQQDVTNAVMYFTKNDTGKLEGWLEEGFDHSQLLRAYFNAFRLNQFKDKDFAMLNLLLSYGANIYLPNVFCTVYVRNVNVRYGRVIISSLKN